jgi:hypothetical protein
MDEHKARTNLEGMIRSDNMLTLCKERYVFWNGNNNVILDGPFTTDELESIAWWVRNKEVK